MTAAAIAAKIQNDIAEVTSVEVKAPYAGSQFIYVRVSGRAATVADLIEDALGVPTNVESHGRAVTFSW